MGVYEELFELFMKKPFALVEAIVDAAQPTDVDHLAKILLSISEAYGVSEDILKHIITREVNQTASEQLLFRANSLATKMIVEYFKKIGRQFLHDQSAVIREVCASGKSYEVNPSKLKEDDNLEEHQMELLRVTQMFSDALFSSAAKLPLPMREVCHHLHKCSQEKYPSGRYNAVGGIVILRYVCPAIITPEVSGLLGGDQKPSPAARRGLVILAKLLQNLANDVLFGQKENFMIPFNDYITKNKGTARAFFEQITRKSSESPAPRPEPKKAVPLEYALDFHNFLATCLSSVVMSIKGVELPDGTNPTAKLCTLLARAGKPPPTRRERERKTEHSPIELKEMAEASFKFVRRFKLPASEQLMVTYKATLERKMSLHGTLQFSMNRVCFFCSVFGMKTREVVPIAEISSIRKLDRDNAEDESSPSQMAIAIDVAGKEFVFTHFFSNKEHLMAYNLLMYFWVIVKHRVGSEALAPMTRRMTHNPPPVPIAGSATAPSVGPNESSVDTKQPEPVTYAEDEAIQMVYDTILTPEDWSKLMEGAQSRPYRRNEFIIKEGEFSQSLYQVGRGTVRVEKTFPGAEAPKVLATMGEGEMFGEMSFLEGSTVSASIVADEDHVEIYVIGGKFVESLLQEEIGLPGRVYKYLATLLAVRLANRTNKLGKPPGAAKDDDEKPADKQQSDNQVSRLRSVTLSLKKTLTHAPANDDAQHPNDESAGSPAKSATSPRPSMDADANADLSLMEHKPHSRDKKVRKQLDMLPDESILYSFPCELERKLAVTGRVYVTPIRVGFSGKIIGYKAIECVKLANVLMINGISPNLENVKAGVEIVTADKFLVLSHLKHKAHSMSALTKVWEAAQQNADAHLDFPDVDGGIEDPNLRSITASADGEAPAQSSASPSASEPPAAGATALEPDAEVPVSSKAPAATSAPPSDGTAAACGVTQKPAAPPHDGEAGGEEPDDDEDAEQQMTNKDWALFLEGAKKLTFHKNEPVVTQGLPGNAIYQIGCGSARAEVRYGATEEVNGETVTTTKSKVLRIMGEGEVFGDISFLTAGEATASVVADQNGTEVYAVETSWCESLLTTNPELPGKFYKYLAVRLCQRLRDGGPAKRPKPKAPERTPAPAVKVDDPLPPAPAPPSTAILLDMSDPPAVPAPTPPAAVQSDA